MALKKFAILALAAVPTLARPSQDNHHNHHAGLHERKLEARGPYSSGHSIPAGTGGSSAPYPAGNSTSGAATGTAGPTGGPHGPVTLISTVQVFPQPITTKIVVPGEKVKVSGGPEGPEASESGAAASGGPGESGAPGGSDCGAATITKTVANTVTVTVTPSAQGPGGPGGPGAGASSKPPPPSSLPPFPVGNSTSAAGTGTGTAPPPPPAPLTTSSSVPVEVPATSSIPQPVAQNKHKVPNYQHRKPSSSSSVYVAPQETPVEVAPVEEQPVYTPAAVYTPAPVQTPAAEESSPAESEEGPAPAKTSSASKPKTKSPSSVGPKGIIYNDATKANSLDVAWACNWGQTPGVSNPSWEYVPQLWGLKNGFETSIASNAEGAKHVLFYNEPDIDPGVGGSGIAAGQAASDWTSYMAPLQKAGKQVSTPCVANSGGSYMTEFLDHFPAGTIDILCFHWYGPDIEGLKRVVEEFKGYKEKYGLKEMWISEFAVQPTPNDLSEFTSYLDGAVDRYAYNLNNLNGAQY